MKELIQKGVKILQPESTWIDPGVNPANVSESAIIYPGCRITGTETSIGPACVIGEETPATVDNCQLGAKVHLKGGYFSGSVFLDDVSVASSAHIRPACILEEQVACGHAVGLKQSVIFPFVALGSLINFCDCLIAGGTDRSNHSEIGSSYVHFNYSAHRHKATPSLFGDVARGVLIENPPIFLGGQGGAVGPTSVEYGTLTAAGTILRRDVNKSGQLVFGSASAHLHQHSFNINSFGDLNHIVNSNIRYIANLHALKEWYLHVRALFAKDIFSSNCCKGADNCLAGMITERIAQLRRLADRVRECTDEAKTDVNDHLSFVNQLHSKAALIGLNASFTDNTEAKDGFLSNLAAISNASGYLQSIRSCNSTAKSAATTWLDSIVTAVINIWNS